MARWVKAIRKGRDAVQDNLRTGQPLVENNTVQLLSSLLDVDHRWTAHKLAAEAIARRIPYEISEEQQRHRYAVAHALLDRYQREGDDFLERIVTMDETWAR